MKFEAPGTGRSDFAAFREQLARQGEPAADPIPTPRRFDPLDVLRWMTFIFQV